MELAVIVVVTIAIKTLAYSLLILESTEGSVLDHKMSQHKDLKIMRKASCLHVAVSVCVLVIVSVSVDVVVVVAVSVDVTAVAAVMVVGSAVTVIVEAVAVEVATMVVSVIVPVDVTGAAGNLLLQNA